MYRDHSFELMPIMSRCARLCQRPPRSRTSCSRAVSHTCSESIRTPSRSKTTASITTAGTGGPGRGAAASHRRARTRAPRRRRTCGRRPATRAHRAHSSQPSAPSISRAPCSPSRVSIPCQCAIGGTPRAKCWATASWPAASRLTANPPASRSSSCSAASRATEIPTSGGSRESETSVPTVNPRPSPSASTLTTATPAGNRRINARTSPTGRTQSATEAGGLREHAGELDPRAWLGAADPRDDRGHSRPQRRRPVERALSVGGAEGVAEDPGRVL